MNGINAQTLAMALCAAVAVDDRRLIRDIEEMDSSLRTALIAANDSDGESDNDGDSEIDRAWQCFDSVSASQRTRSDGAQNIRWLCRCLRISWLR